MVSTTTKYGNRTKTQAPFIRLQQKKGEFPRKRGFSPHWLSTVSKSQTNYRSHVSALLVATVLVVNSISFLFELLCSSNMKGHNRMGFEPTITAIYIMIPTHMFNVNIFFLIAEIREIAEIFHH